MRLILTLLCLLFLQPIFAQKVLQIEKFGDPVTEKINIGAFLTYQLKNDDIWSQGYIRDLRIDLDVIELDDRFVNINDIAAFQYRRTWPKKVGTQLALFGLAWSGYALIGTLTDGNPDTNYQWSDAIVTGAAAGIGLSLPLVFGKKTIRFDKRRRLRMLDITF
ncbi:MAG: hypothetical protein Sapg2KO_11930 [Saprospiraceae bacterium]